MLSNALALALLTTSGFVIVYRKLPRKVRRYIEKYSLVADVAALILVYVLLGGTLTALVAAAMVGLFVSALLHIAHEDNKEDFLFLYDLMKYLKEKTSQARQALKDYGQMYRKKKLAEQAATSQL